MEKSKLFILASSHCHVFFVFCFGFPYPFAYCIEINIFLKLLLLYYNMIHSVLIVTCSLVDDRVYN